MALTQLWTGLTKIFLKEKTGDSVFYEDVSETSSIETVAAIYSAINILSESTASLNRYVARRVGEDEPYYEYLPDHPINQLLKSPSPFVDGRLFWEIVARALVSSGNVWLWVRRLDNGLPSSLWPGTAKLNYNATRYEFIPFPLDGRKQQKLDLPKNRVMGIHGPGFMGISSPSPIQYAANQTACMMAQAQKYQLNRFSSGIYSQTVIEAEPSLEGTDMEDLKNNAQKITGLIKSAQKAGTIPILFPGYRLSSPGSVSAADLEIVELLRYGVEDVARVFNFHPAMLGVRQTSKTDIKEIAEYFTRWTLRPVVERIQDAVSFHLLSRADKRDNLQVVFDLDRSRLGTWSDLIQTLDRAYARAGLMTLNEARRRAGMAPVDGGDIILVPKGSPSDPALGGEGGNENDPNEEPGTNPDPDPDND